MSAKDNQGGDVGFWVVVLILVVVIALLILYFDKNQRQNSILMLQIGLSGEASYLQRNLQSIAASTNTSTLAGLNTILRGFVFNSLSSTFLAFK